MTLSATGLVRRGRAAPHNLEAEESLLGAMLLSRDAIGVAAEQHVGAEMFYQPRHGAIFAAVMELYTRGDPADPVTVEAELRRAGGALAAGMDRAALLELQAATPASANATQYARIVCELALLRQLIAAGSEIAELGFDVTGDVTETLDRAESLVFQVAERRLTDTMTPLARAIPGALDRLEARFADPDGATLVGTPTGLAELDELVLGLRRGSLVVVAARPGVGKSMFALNVAANIVLRNAVVRPVLMFSLEMSQDEITDRLLASEAMVEVRALQTGRLTARDWERISAVVGPVSQAPLIIDDNAHCTVMEMRAKARRIKASYGDLGLVIVDYLQLMAAHGTFENRQAQVASISRELKVLAKELDCPVMALSSLNRQLEYRADKRPLLADLRESGAIESDADLVLMLYRPELYSDDLAERGILEVAVAKHRAGGTGQITLAWLGNKARVVSLAPGATKDTATPERVPVSSPEVF